jgi:hypothetical protein
MSHNPFENVLNIHSVNLATKGGYGNREYWQINISNPTRSWKYCKPFSSNSNIIILNECEECYMCGLANTSVYATDYNIIWTRNTQSEMPAYELHKGEYIVFGISDYISTLDLLRTPEIDMQLKRLTVNDFVNESEPGIVLSNINKCIYTSHSLSNDEYGKLIAQYVNDVLYNNPASIDFIESPSNYYELTVTCDAYITADMILRIGFVNNTIALLCIANPCMPLWLGINPNHSLYNHLSLYLYDLQSKYSDSLD